VLSLAFVEYLDPTGTWTLATPAMFVADVSTFRLRLVSTSSRAFCVDYVLGEQVFFWELPVGTSTRQALSEWTPQLQSAVFASLRKRGNKFRHDQLVQKLFSTWASPDSAFRDYVALKSSSYLEPYWYISDAHAARRILRARVGCWGDEYCFRRQPRALTQLHHQTTQSLKDAGIAASLFRVGRLLPVLKPEERACYLCSVDIWMPETLAHVFLHCQHAALHSERQRIKGELASLFAHSSSIIGAPPVPDLDDDVSLYAVLLLCTGIGQLQHVPSADAGYQLDVLVPVGVRTRAAVARASAERLLAERRRDHRVRLSAARMRPAVLWTSFFANRWLRAIATLKPDAFPPAACVGRSLISIVCDHSQRVYAARRRALRGHLGFAIRDRDPCVSTTAPADTIDI